MGPNGAVILTPRAAGAGQVPVADGLGGYVWETLVGGGVLLTKATIQGTGLLSSDIKGEPQGLVVEPEDFGAEGDGVEFSDGAITSGLKVLATSASSSIALNPPVVNQRVYIEGAGAAGVGLRSYITAVNYTAHTITINDAAGTTITSGGEGCFGTDDTTAFNLISYSGGAWAQADAEGNATVLLGSKKYMLDGTPTGTANAIWQLGITGGSIKITGVSGHTKLLTTRNVDTYTSGQTPKVMGVPVVVGITPFIQNYGRFEMTGVTIQLPGNPTIGGINVNYAGRLFLDDFIVTNYLAGVSLPTHVWQAGIILPNSQNFGEVHLGYVLCSGNYCNFAIQDLAHLTPIRPIAQNGVVAYGIDDNAGGGHATHALYLMAEHHQYVLAGWTPDVGVKSKPSATPKVPIKIGLLDIEDASAPFASVAHILDANNMLYGEVTFLRWAAAIQPSITITGGQNLLCKSLRPGDNGTGSPFIQIFNTPGTFTCTKPGGVNEADVVLVGGGGGGQSGATAAASVAAAGGGGGGGAGWSRESFDADSISPSTTVIVGAGGAGGTAVSANNTAGGWSGKSGGSSSFGGLTAAAGGFESTAGVAGGETQGGAAGGAASTTTTGGAGGDNGKVGSGGAGGSISAANAILGFGAGGAQGTIGGVSGSSGQAGTSTSDTNLPIGGGGGAGGAAATSGTATTGGGGGKFGGGGGGGGAARNGGTSGAGGKGGDGIVIVRWR